MTAEVNAAIKCSSITQGYTIPLDKRLAADGRGLQTVHINENFAKLAEALYIADRKVSKALVLYMEHFCFCFGKESTALCITVTLPHY